MVAQMKEEYLAAGIRQQIESLQQVINELEADRLASEAIACRLRAVEMGLRRLREAA